MSRTALKDAYEWSWRHDWLPPENSEPAQEFLKIRQAFTKLLNDETLKIYRSAAATGNRGKVRPS